jgi:4-amino-4-deoxy-L-arabinose transferase-like glycosyltransferase
VSTMIGLDRRSTLHFGCLLALCVILYLPPIYRLPFFDKGEPREALEVQFIVTEGRWVFPLKSGGDIPSKPPLFHWLGALSSVVWGEINEATVRFPSALLGTIGVLTLYLFGRRAFDCNVALLAGAVLATTFIYQKQAVEARVDMTLCFFVTVSLMTFYALYQGWLSPSFGFYGFYFLLGVGVLAKGPVSLILSGMPIVIFLAIKKRWDFLSRLCFHKGVLLTLGIGLSWYVLAVFQGGEGFVGRQIIKENVARFFVYGEGGTGHQKPVYYYLPYLFLEGLPWTLFLPFMIVEWLKKKSFSEEISVFLILWIAVVFVFFSLAAGKRGVYMLPLYPALALLTAQWFQDERKPRAMIKLGLRVVGVVCMLVGIVSAVGFLWSLSSRPSLRFFSMLQPGRDEEVMLVVESVLKNYGWTLRGFLGAAVLLWFLSAWDCLRVRAQRFAVKLALVSMVSWLLVQIVIVPTFADSRSYGPFMKEVNEFVAHRGNVYLYGEGFDSSSIVFYHGGPITELKETPLALIGRLRSGKDGVIMSEKEWRRIQSLDEHLNIRVIKSRGTGPDGDAPLVFVPAPETKVNF